MAICEWNNLRTTLFEMQKWEAERYKAQLKSDDRVATSKLYDSVKALQENIVFTVVDDTDRFEIYLQMEDYWKYIESGTVPHWPPSGALMDWVKVRRSSLLERFKGNGKRLPTDKQLEFLVRRKIAQFGTEGKPSLKMTLDEANKFWTAKIGEAIAKDVNEMTVEVIRYIMQPPK